MEKITLPSHLMKNTLTWVSDQCEQHKISLMVVKGKVVCPRCELDKNTQQLQATIQKEYEEMESAKQYNTFYKQSIVADESLLKARIHNYQTEHPEEVENKNIVLEAFARFRDGETFNLVLQGKQGTGKSHLTYGILHALNELGKFSTLFISVDEMLRLIKDSFNNRESRFTESYFVSLLSSVDFLGLDDLGAETGAINTDKSATDFVQRVLYGVTNARQSKSTILTTNLGSQDLMRMYDKKLVSRLLKNPKFVLFKESKDKRISSYPF